ncbi:MAG: hypothetical protein OEZ68_21805 [Gammaproteobacteria bacterium]|nr:hypothetical protein [Gammaproteobacteria bacterium]MDH5803434.1 hypothetical protein [Gammaproteobacteria bacterium]
MPVNYDRQQLFIFEPELDIGLRAGAFDGYGNVNDLDLVRKRAALNTWMNNVKHEASAEHLRTRGMDTGYIEWLPYDLDDINCKCKAKFYWDQLQLVVNSNNDPNNPYNDTAVKENLEQFNKYWNSEHKQLMEAASKRPYKEGTGTWTVVHANQQPGLAVLFNAGILSNNLSTFNGHKYNNIQGKSGMLPKRTNYWAYDYDTGKSTRGAARVVVGPVDAKNNNKREVWFTDNHYATFVRVIKGNNLVLDAHK